MLGILDLATLFHLTGAACVSLHVFKRLNQQRGIIGDNSLYSSCDEVVVILYSIGKIYIGIETQFIYLQAEFRCHIPPMRLQEFTAEIFHFLQQDQIKGALALQNTELDTAVDLSDKLRVRKGA